MPGFVKREYTQPCWGEIVVYRANGRSVSQAETLSRDPGSVREPWGHGSRQLLPPGLVLPFLPLVYQEREKPKSPSRALFRRI